MYEEYSRQALPPKDYRELLGSALCVFNSNNSFVIENILKEADSYNWYELIDKESGQLKPIISKNIAISNGGNIADMFNEIVIMRNRIIHGFQVSGENGEQILATKSKVKEGNQQFIITKEYLLDFIKMNEDLSSALHEFRGY